MPSKLATSLVVRKSAIKSPLYHIQPERDLRRLCRRISPSYITALCYPCERHPLTDQLRFLLSARKRFVISFPSASFPDDRSRRVRPGPSAAPVAGRAF